MKTNDLQSALQAFLQNNPDLPQGEDIPADEPKAATALPRLIIRLETKGRKGKPATIVSGLAQLEPDRVSRIAAELKKRLATGGSYRDNEILIQGDRRRDVADALHAMGFKTN